MKNKRTVLPAIAFVIAVAAAAGVSAATTNLVLNGSFEGDFAGDSLLDHWTTIGSALDGYPPVAIPYNQAAGVLYPNGAQGEPIPPDSVTSSLSPDAAGAHGVYFVTDNASGLALVQTIHLDAGSYDIGFDSYDTFNGSVQPADAYLTAEILGVTVADFSLSSVSPGVWSTHAGVAQIQQAGDYQITFAFSTPDAPTNAKDVIIDRAFVVADAAGGGVEIPTGGVPEPASWALMILGFGTVGAALRRRPAGASAAILGT